MPHRVDHVARDLKRTIDAALPKLRAISEAAATEPRERGKRRRTTTSASSVRRSSHVMTQIPDASLPVECVIESTKPVTLEFLVTDYVRHLRHHLAQVGVA